VHFGYRGRRVFEGISAELTPGMNFVAGLNGAGKTTLFRLILGELRPQHGAISNASRGQIGYLPQAFGYPPRFTLRQFVEHFAWLHRVPARQRAPRAETALDRVGLTERSGDRMGTLSGGMLRRAGIAQALVHDPQILLLDEPTAGLDPRQQLELRALLPELAASMTVVVGTHLLDDVSAIGGRVILLADGTARFSGDATDLSQLASDGSGSLHRAFLDLTAAEGGIRK
jgi:ABC-2 type transport system ATP-binding protein